MTKLMFIIHSVKNYYYQFMYIKDKKIPLLDANRFVIA